MKSHTKRNILTNSFDRDSDQAGASSRIRSSTILRFVIGVDITDLGLLANVHPTHFTINTAPSDGLYFTFERGSMTGLMNRVAGIFQTIDRAEFDAEIHSRYSAEFKAYDAARQIIKAARIGVYKHCR